MDNNSGRDVSIRGVSRNSVGRALAALLLTVETVSQAYTWFARIPSPANVADEPSRTVMQSMNVRGQDVARFSCENFLGAKHFEKLKRLIGGNWFCLRLKVAKQATLLECRKAFQAVQLFLQPAVAGRLASATSRAFRRNLLSPQD